MSSPPVSVWRNPWVRGPLVLCALLILIVGTCDVAIDHMGKAAWRGLRAHLAPETSLDLASLLQPPLPDEQNFCALPPLRNLAAPEKDPSPAGEEGRRKRAELNALGEQETVVISAMSIGGIQHGSAPNYVVLADAMKADSHFTIPATAVEPMDVIAAGCERWEPLARELAGGLTRPSAQSTPALTAAALSRPYSENTDPSLTVLLRVGNMLKLRAVVAAQRGDFGKAIESLRLLRMLSRAAASRPMLINAMVEQSLASLSAAVTWELCRTTQASPEQWESVEQILESYDMHESLTRGLTAELAIISDAVRYTGEHREEKALLALLPGSNPLALALGGPPPPGARAGLLLARALPTGFYDGVAAEMTDKLWRHLVQPLRTAGWPAAMAGRRTLAGEIAADEHRPWRLMRSFGGGSLYLMGWRVSPALYVQVSLDQARIACVLERVRLATGSYPETLNGLAMHDGAALPNDASNGEPMHYQRTPEGYLLWSMGPDGVDDQAQRGTGPMSEAEYHGDWVWKCARQH